MNFIINTDLTVNKNEEASLSGDINIFIVGKKLTKEKIVQKVKNIYKWLTDFYEQKPTIKMYNETATMLVKNHKIQVITQRTFSSVSELLNSFDLDCCRFAFDGKSLITVKRGYQFLTTNKVSVCKQNTLLRNNDAPVDRYRVAKLTGRIK